MEFRTLKYFLAIAREENMTSAANILHVSQSALSRQMLDLEAQLGKQLFVRTNRNTLLTEDGMHLKKRAEEIISLMERTEMEFQSTDESVRGEIHIGAEETPAMRLITHTVRRLQEQNPLLRLHLYSGSMDYVTGRLDRGVLDFGLLFEPVGKEKYDYIPFPVKDTLGILTRRDSPYAKLRAVTPAELLQLNLISSVQKNTLPAVLSNWLGSDSGSLHYTASYNMSYNASLMVEAGIGNALMIQGLVNAAEGSGVCFLPLEPELKLELVFVWKKYQMLSKAAELFLSELQKDFSAIPL